MFEDAADFGPGGMADGQKISPLNEGGGEDGFALEDGAFFEGEVVEIEFGMGGEAVEAVELELKGHGGAAEGAAQGGGLHVGQFGELHVPADGLGDALDEGEGLFETPQDGFGKLGSGFGMVGGAVPGGAIGLGLNDEALRLGDIVQERGPDELWIARCGEVIEHEGSVRPYIALRVPLGVLEAAAQGDELGEELLQKAGLKETLQCRRGFSGHFAEGAGEFDDDALDAYGSEGGGMPADGSLGGGVDGEAESRCKANGAHHAQAIFGEAAIGIADGADEAGGKVGLPAHIIEDGLAFGVVEEAVDGEIAAEGIVLGGGEGNGIGAAAILIAAIGAEGRHIKGFPAAHHENHAKGFAHGNRLPRKERFNLFGERARGNIDIVHAPPQKRIAHASARKEGCVPGGAQMPGNGFGCFGGGWVWGIKGKIHTERIPYGRLRINRAVPHINRFFARQRETVLTNRALHGKLYDMKCKWASVSTSLSGQAIAELVITMILFLIIASATVHFATLAFAQLELKSTLRAEAGVDAMGRASRMLPEAISDWSAGADGRVYTADDQPVSGGVLVFSRLHEYAEVDGGAMMLRSHLEDSPARLSDDGFSLFQLGLIRRSDAVDVPVDPFLQDTIYSKPTIKLRETRWMPLMGGMQ